MRIKLVSCYVVVLCKVGERGYGVPPVEQIIKLIKATDHKVRQVMAIGKVYNNVLFVETKSNTIRSFQR